MQSLRQVRRQRDLARLAIDARLDGDAFAELHPRPLTHLAVEKQAMATPARGLQRGPERRSLLDAHDDGDARATDGLADGLRDIDAVEHREPHQLGRERVLLSHRLPSSHRLARGASDVLGLASARLVAHRASDHGCAACVPFGLLGIAELQVGEREAT